MIYAEDLGRNYSELDWEQCIARAESWIRRNVREWPYDHYLVKQITWDGKASFWFQKGY